MSSSKVVVTIKGSLTPSVVVPRGEERTVILTPRIQRLIDRGYVTVTERHVVKGSPKTTPKPKPNPEPEVESE